MEKIMAGKKSAPAIRYRLNRLAELIDDKKIRDVSKQEIVAALDKIAEGQRNGKPAKQLTGEILTQAKRLWRFAKSRDWVTFSCLEELTRRDFDAKPTKRDVTLRLDELAVVWKTLDNPEQCKSDPISIAALKLLILTGQRESEVCKSKWTEFDLSNGLWKIPAERTKTKRAHLVHLAPQAIAVLENIHPISGAGDYVFASPIKPGQPIYGRSVNNALVTLFTKGCLSNIARCRVHDFRRTLITKLPDLGFEPFIGHKIANHVLSGVFAHYNHNSYEELRKKALLEWASRLELLVNNSNVLPFQKSVK
jgi:integrase